MANNKEIFGQRLKSAREMKGLSMADLSRELSGLVTRQSICKYEAGIMLPDSAVLLRLARILDVKSDYFFRPFLSLFPVSSSGRKHLCLLRPANLSNNRSWIT